MGAERVNLGNLMKTTLLAIISAVFSAACFEAGVETDARDSTVRATAMALHPGGVTDPVETGAMVNAAFWTDPAAVDRNLIVAAAGSGGLDLYHPDGRRAGHYAGVEAGFVSVLDGVALDDGTAPLIVLYDARASALRSYRLDRDGLQLREVSDEPVLIADELVGLCQYESPLSGSRYVYAVTDSGTTLQFELFARGGKLAAQLVRSIPTGKDSGFCAVDTEAGLLYFSEEGMGIWRLGAEPESETVREPVDLRAPWGGLSGEIKGIGIYRISGAGRELSYLIAADAGESRLAVYRLSDLAALGAVTVTGLSEAEGVAATSRAMGDGYPHGLVAITDEDESDGGTDIKLVAWQSFADALQLQSGSGAPTAAADARSVVRPTLETEIADNFGDAADDPAIWVNAADPSRSLVIGTDKKLGLYVYDLDGHRVQTLPDGKLNNVDLRYDFPFGGERVAVVAASNRSTDGISLYKVDADALRLVEIADGILPTGFIDPYGLCMYRSVSSGDFYVFINEGGDGKFRQWRLFDNGHGRVAAEQVREFPVDSQTEGCVADDELGFLYVGEEDRGIWKYAAEPDGGSDRVPIDSTGDGGHLTDDVEGLALWIGEEGRGYLIASNQGADNYAVYRREGDNAWVGHFHIVADAEHGIDGASETDGLDVTSAALGERYPAGLLVVQDGRNVAPEERQNFKYVSWQDVARTLGLE
jgi:3-phytase